jgi:membrane protease YdiL (CAAX protease family)
MDGLVPIDARSAPNTAGKGPPALKAGRATWIFAVYVLVQLGVGLAGGIFAGVYAGAFGLSADEAAAFISGEALFPITLVAILAGGVAVLAMVRPSYPGLIRNGVLAPLGWTPSSLSSSFAALLCGCVVAMIYLRVGITVSPPAPTQEFGPIATEAATAVGWPKLFWVALLLAAAPIEEFIFRGAMLEGFTRSFGSLFAGLIVTGLFVASHLPETNFYIPAIIAITALSIGTLAARWLTGSLLPPILLHAAYNFVIAAESFG